MAFVLVLALAACAARDAGESAAPAPIDMQGWRLASGKPPSKAEFTALVAACEDRAKAGRAGPIDECLAGFGLRRTP
ncbi:MAG: hypothetical protein JO267_02605 [Alphaproteobacteria bacterium]|nr:hypothetical protein [Alphaproteobacteria bacterium]